MSEFCPYTYKDLPTRLKYPWTHPMPSENERDIRWQAFRKSMKKHNLDCLIVCAPLGPMPTFHRHLYYLTNYSVFGNPAPGTYLIFPLKGEPLLLVSNAIGPQFAHVAAQTSWIDKVVGTMNPVKEILNKVRELNLEKGRLGLVGLREGVFPASLYIALHDSLTQVTFEDPTMAVNEAMNTVSRTSEEETAFLKTACQILDRSFEAVAEALKPGVKEYELWAVAEQAILANGGWFGHFMLATSGPSPTFPKAPAAHNALSRGDVVIFEINSIYGGITPQICYALSLGKPKREIEEMFELVKELYDFSLVELGKKRTFLDVELELAQRIHKAGYEPMTPQIHLYNMAFIMPMESTPQPGDYFTVHPNFCNKGYTGGAKFGDTVRITQEGKVERLFKTPAKLNII
jgi:Xaa-Pro dipeptidase